MMPAVTAKRDQSASKSLLNSTSTTTAGRMHSNTAVAGKGAESARRPFPSASDGTAAQRRNTGSRAWASGPNPTQQSASSDIVNCDVNTEAQKSGGTHIITNGKQIVAPESSANDRMLFLLANFTGLTAFVTTKGGESYRGIFTGSVTEPGFSRYTLKMVKRIQLQPQNESDIQAGDCIGTGEDHVMSFDVHDVSEISCSSILAEKSHARAHNALTGSFMTDVDISGKLAMRERNLQRWEPANDFSTDLGLGDSGNVAWDQFETNERLYGVRTDYDEAMYTTTIDRSNPQYRERLAVAERLAKEIEGSNTANAHVAEERGLASSDSGGLDEEEKYSGVRRDNGHRPVGQDKNSLPAQRIPVSPSQSYVPLPNGPNTSLPVPSNDETITNRVAGINGTADPITSESSLEHDSLGRLQGASTQSANTLQAPVPGHVYHGSKLDMTLASAVSSKNLSESNSKRTVSSQPSSLPKRAAKPENATASVEHDLLDSFKQFSANEKMRVQERQRSIARQDKAVKLNDLKKFSVNFKLNTPVPSDLIPILAKDKSKQEAIKEKAQRQVEESQSIPAKSVTAAEDIRGSRPVLTVQSGMDAADAHLLEGQVAPRVRQDPDALLGHTVRKEKTNHSHASVVTVPPNALGSLTDRLRENQLRHKAGQANASVSPPTPILHDQRTSGTRHLSVGSPPPLPTSAVATRLNVQASEFKPTSFVPVASRSASPSSKAEVNARIEPSATPVAHYFLPNDLDVTAERRDFSDAFDTLRRLKDETEAEKRTRDFAQNGGIPQAYRTPPTWEILEANRDKTFADVFDGLHSQNTAVSPGHTIGNTQLSGHHQYPVPFQQIGHNIPHSHTPGQTPRHQHAQPHHSGMGPFTYEDQRMQFSASTPSVQPSPRMQHNIQHYNAPLGQPMQVYSQGMPFNASPHAVPPRPVGGTAPYLHQQSQAMGNHMMNTTSTVPYMGSPGPSQISMYASSGASPFPVAAAPHGLTSTNSFPSPRPAPIMSHQGSQQGNPGQSIMYIPGQAGVQVYAPHSHNSIPGRTGYVQVPQPHQPPFTSQLYQPYHHLQQNHRLPSNGTYHTVTQNVTVAPHTSPSAQNGGLAESGD